MTDAIRRAAEALADLPLAEARAAFDRAYLAAVIRQSRTMTEAAQRAGISRQWLHEMTRR